MQGLRSITDRELFNCYMSTVFRGIDPWEETDKFLEWANLTVEELVYVQDNFEEFSLMFLGGKNVD